MKSKKIENNCNITVEHRHGGNYYKYGTDFIFVYKKIVGSRLHIKKVSDEWFLIKIIYSNPFNIISPSDTFWKCDQIDTLINFINDIKYIL